MLKIINERMKDCPSSTFKINFDYEGIPFDAIMHMMACENCREFIASPPLRREFNKSLLCIRDLSMSKWKENPNAHLSNRHLQLLIKMYYNQADSEMLISHIERCEKCYNFAIKNKAKYQRKHKQ